MDDSIPKSMVNVVERPQKMYDWYDEGAATLASGVDHVRERLRLFYVGITRAKKELIVTWNTGRQGEAIPSLPFSALMGWWEAVGMNM